MPLEIDLQRIAILAAARFDDFEVLRYQLQNDDAIDDTKLDALVESIAAPIRAAIDCKQCANCCKSLDVFVTPSDIQRLVSANNESEQSFHAKHVQHSDNEAELRLHACPCVFLRGKLCSVYASRPDACRIYPAFTPYFCWTIEDSIQGAASCPITYNVLSALVEQIDSLYDAISVEVKER